ncbi:uncharacterized [Lates japonicus]
MFVAEPRCALWRQNKTSDTDVYIFLHRDLRQSFILNHLRVALKMKSGPSINSILRSICKKINNRTNE